MPVTSSFDTTRARSDAAAISALAFDVPTLPVRLPRPLSATRFLEAENKQTKQNMITQSVIYSAGNMLTTVASLLSDLDGTG